MMRQTGQKKEKETPKRTMGKPQSTRYEWMTEDEAAEYIRYCPRSLQRWRQDGCIMSRSGKVEQAPPYYKRAGKIFYERHQLDMWMLEGRGPSFSSSTSMEM